MRNVVASRIPGASTPPSSPAHGDDVEYRKRLFWRAQEDGFKPLLPWVKRHMFESATFHLTYSVPGSLSLKRSHPEAFLGSQLGYSDVRTM